MFDNRGREEGRMGGGWGRVGGAAEKKTLKQFHANYHEISGSGADLFLEDRKINLSMAGEKK